MCLPLIAAGAAIIGAGMSVGGAVVNANAQRTAGEAAEAKAKENAFNATIAAGDARLRGAEEAGRATAAASTIVGEQRATYGASGVAVGVGTAGDQEKKTIEAGEIDAGTIRRNAQREAWGYLRQGEDFIESGKAAKAQADGAATATLLGGAADFAVGMAKAGSYLGDATSRTGMRGNYGGVNRTLAQMGIKKK